ncbi:NAD-dependent epimerase/dehydratase family protein [Halomicroarcula sp. GCM10025709]|uniref:NAD-dependent epimerase/dehydratase family protein n=1 Tax=Haloarcula TaxID=2237 RepID=UPI0024C441A5|nr:NAD-dependent epimerase/dehydratase family protein [Halomicroarcula sp. YJ-61-S]
MTETPTGRQVLVTGGAGFIGSHIADAFLPENDVRILDDFSSGSRERCPAGATVIEGDIRDRETIETAMDGVDLVFHEAAVVSVAQSVEDPETSHATNVDATLSILEAARRADARVVFASSAAIYGAPESIPIAEDDRKEPSSPYGLEKLSGDHYCRLYHDLYGLETVPLRYFNVYGPGQTGGDYAGVINVFTDQARDGGPLTVDGDGEQYRDFVHIDDIVQANVLAATTDATGRAYNVGTGERTTIRELAEAIRDRIDPDADIVHTDPRPGDIRESRPDISRARDQLGYEPTVSLGDGLDDLLG